MEINVEVKVISTTLSSKKESNPVTVVEFKHVKNKQNFKNKHKLRRKKFSDAFVYIDLTKMEMDVQNKSKKMFETLRSEGKKLVSKNFL